MDHPDRTLPADLEGAAHNPQGAARQVAGEAQATRRSTVGFLRRCRCSASHAPVGRGGPSLQGGDVGGLWHALARGELSPGADSARGSSLGHKSDEANGLGPSHNLQSGTFLFRRAEAHRRSRSPGPDSSAQERRHRRDRDQPACLRRRDPLFAFGKGRSPRIATADAPESFSPRVPVFAGSWWRPSKSGGRAGSRACG